MGFNRSLPLCDRPDSAVLTAQMVGIGMAFAADPLPNPNIEDVLLFASDLGIVEGDLRVLSMLTQWVGIHSAQIHANRLLRALKAHPEGRVRAFWSAVGRWLAKDQRFDCFVKLYTGGPVDLLPVGTDFQIERHGEDARFRGSVLRVPAGTLRQREADVLSPVALAGVHNGYRIRVLMGPTWRADVWTVLEADPDLSIAEIARRAYCAFATAWQVKRDFDLLRAVS